MQGPKRLDFTPEQVELLLDRINSKQLAEDDFPLLADLLKAIIWMEGALKEKELSIVRLRSIFGIKTESAKKLFELAQGQANATGSSTQNNSKEESSEPAQNNQKSEEPEKKGKSKGHGHRSASEYQEAKTIKIAHECLKRGDRCPKCGKGRLFNLSPGTVLRIVGQPWLDVHIYKPERLRCPNCQQIFTAKLPEEVATQGRTDATAKAIVSLLKYRGGVPFNRQEKIQGILGKPLSASEIWEMTEDVADCGQPVFSALCTLAANAECIHNDDTTSKILSVMKENEQENPERTGVFTTALLAKTEDKQIALFFTGRQHAGENLNDVLDKRDPDLGPPIQSCDALSRNIPKDHKTNIGNCNAHARREFYEIASKWPKEILQIVSWFDIVFANDARALKDGMDAETRLKWHQEMSKPIMDGMKVHCEALIDKKQVEPNSSFGKAIAYLNNHWEGLTLFLRMPGVPLSNNDNERLIKNVVRNRKNAYFFKTEAGARIADVLMSLIETCCLNKVSPWDYLLAIQLHAAEVFKSPINWLPWNYRQAASDTS